LKNYFLWIIFFLLFFTDTNAEVINENNKFIPSGNDQKKLIINVDFMRQGNMGCSRTCFAMVMHYYNPSITLEMVEKEAPKASDGGSQNNLMAVLAEHYGFETHAFPGTIEGLIQLLKSGKPVIVAQYPSIPEKKSNHDRVVVGFDKDKEILFVHDPSVGENIPYAYENFLALWESNVGLDDKYTAIIVIPAETKSKESRNISIDGMDEDWQGIAAFSPDRYDDTGKSDLNLNIKNVYCYKDDTSIYLKTGFIKPLKSDPDIIYFFNFFYYTKDKSDIRQLNFRLKQSPWIQIDDRNYEPMTNVEWRSGNVFEARIGLENFKSLPDVVSIQAGIYDTKRKKFIDLSYPNAMRIK